MRFFVICTETSPKRSMFLVSVIPILVRVSEYAYIFCSVKIKMNSRIIGIHLASPPPTVTCTLTACYSFTAMSTGTSSNVTGLLFCSQTEALVLVFFFSYLNQKKLFFLYCLLFWPISKGNMLLCHFHIYVCRHCLNAIFVSFPLLSERKPKVFFSQL